MKSRRNSPGPPVDPSPACGECGSTPCACRDSHRGSHFLANVCEVCVVVPAQVIVREDDEGVVIVQAWYQGAPFDEKGLAQIDRGLIEVALGLAKKAEPEEAPELSTDAGAMTTEQIEKALLREPFRATREALAAARRRKTAKAMIGAYHAAGRDEEADAVTATAQDQEILHLLRWCPRYRKDVLRAFSDEKTAVAALDRLLRAGKIVETREGDDPVLSLPRGGGHA